MRVVSSTEEQSSLKKASTMMSDSVHFLGAAKSNDHKKLVEIGDLTDFIKNLLSKLGVQTLSDLEHSFSSNDEQFGYTAIYCLAESHIAIHTWPEHDFVEFDVYLCNNLRNNVAKCRLIYEAILNYYSPTIHQTQRITRPRAAAAFKKK